MHGLKSGCEINLPQRELGLGWYTADHVDEKLASLEGERNITQACAVCLLWWHERSCSMSAGVGRYQLSSY